MQETSPGLLDRILAGIVPRLGDILARFPLGVFCATALTLFLILVAEDIQGWSKDVDLIVRIAGLLACGGLWSVSAVLVAEARGASSLAGHGAGALGVLVFGLAFWFHRELDVVEFGLIAALVLLVGLAPYLFRPRDDRAFWAFNHDTWIGAAFAVLAALLVAGGVTAILATLEHLFKLDIRKEFWAEVWIIALCFVAPLYWLNTIPRRFDLQVVEGDQRSAELTTRMVTVLVKFILVPLLFAYTAILYAYAVKIGVGWELPKGRLGYMVSAFGVVGVVTAMLVFPSRNHSGALVRLFWRHWFWMTAVPLGLLFVGVWRRIADYGITQERYLLVLVGVWLLGVALLFGLRLLSRDLRLVPGMLALLLGLTAVGPWGLEGLPVRALTGELRDLLAAEGSLDGNGVLKSKDAMPKDRDGAAANRMASIIQYLRHQDRLDRLKPLLGAEADALIVANERDGRTHGYKTVKAVMERLVIPMNQSAGRAITRVSHRSNAPVEVALEGAGDLYGPVTIFVTRPPDGSRTYGDRLKSVDVTIEGDMMQLARSGVVLGRYDLRKVVAQTHRKDRNHAPLVVAPISGTGTSRLVITSLYGEINALNILSMTNITMWIVSPKAP